MSKQSQFIRRQTIDKERGEYTQLRKKKFSYLRHTGMYPQYYEMKRGIKTEKVEKKDYIKIIKKPEDRTLDLVPVEEFSYWKRLTRFLHQHV
ncbi:unnamed protein product, partial [marine sediment metagenome]